MREYGVRLDKLADGTVRVIVRCEECEREFVAPTLRRHFCDECRKRRAYEQRRIAAQRQWVWA